MDSSIPYMDSYHPPWTPRTVDPIDQWTSIKPELLLRSPCYRNTSTLDLISTHASPLRTRPACLSLKVQHHLSSRRLPPDYHGPLHGPPSAAGTHRRRRKGRQPTSRSHNPLIQETQLSAVEDCNLYILINYMHAYACIIYSRMPRQ